MINIVGRRFENNTIGHFGEDGQWHIEVEVKELVTEDGENWIEEKVTIFASHDDFDEAHKGALRALLQFLEEEVYAKGFKSLVELRLHEKGQLSDGTEANNNETTTSESGSN